MPRTKNDETVQLLGGQVDVGHGDPADATSAVHKVIRGFGIAVEELPFRAGDRVFYTGHGYNDLRGRVLTVMWTRRNTSGSWEVKVRWENERGQQRSDVLIGNSVTFLARLADGGPVPPEDFKPHIVEAPGDTQLPAFDYPPAKLAPRDSVISEAADHISGDRAAAYGDAREGFARVAQMWSGILGVEVPVEKVAMMMVALKLSRLSQNPDNRDSWVDVIGYAALGAEVANVKDRV